MGFTLNSPFDIKTSTLKFDAGSFEPAVFPIIGAEKKSKNFEDYFKAYKDGEKDPCKQPFAELIISGDKGDQYSWSDSTRLKLHENTVADCGNLEFVVNDGWTIEIYIKTENADYFNDNLSSDAKAGDYADRLDISGIDDGDSKLWAIMVGGDKLSIDVCSDYSGTKNFYLKTKGTSVGDGNEADFDDTVWVDIQNIAYEGAECDDSDTDKDTNNGDAGQEINNLMDNKMLLFGGAGLLLLLMLR